MDNDSANRFRERKRRRAEMNARPSTTPTSVSEEAVLSFLEEAPDIDWLASVNESRESHYRVGIDLEVTNAEVENLLGDLRGKVTEREFEALLSDVKEQVLNAMIKPFGLAKLLFQDHDGGNVSTIHNAKSGIFANSEDQMRWNEWQAANARPFDRAPYETGFPQRRKETFKQELTIKDAYTGCELNKDGRTHIDHVVSAKELHTREGLGLYFSKDERVEIAVSDSNTTFTDGSLNQSKGELPLREWMHKQRESGETNAEYFGVIEKNAYARDVYARTMINGKLTWEVSGRVMQAGAEEAANMGMQQAFGLLLHELASGLLEESRDFFGQWREGNLNAGVFQELRIRFQRLGERLARKWDDALKAFIEGGISGFLSNLVTFVVNCFLTTFKRVVGIIREGTLSLLRAFKMLLFPPKGMSGREAAHEATKILVSGMAVAAGLGIEEFVSKTLLAFLPVLAPLADAVSTVIAGIITGIGAAVLVYLLDKIDFFGANRQRQHALVMAELEGMAAQADAEAEVLMQMFDAPGLSPEPA